MIKISDVYQSNNIWTSLAATINKDYRPEHTARMVEMFKRAIPELRKLLDFDSSVRFRIAPIKAKQKNGMYMPVSKVVVIDNRLKLSHALEVLAHELVHAEQYHQGRMDWNGGWNYWMGTRWSTNQGTTYNAYRELPWEKEAWGRQEELAKEVDRALGGIYLPQDC